MRISETASKNHEKLFPSHKSTLKVTDRSSSQRLTISLSTKSSPMGTSMTGRG